MAILAKPIGSDDLLKSPESPLNLLKSGLMVYLISQIIVISYISIFVCRFCNKTDKYITFTHSHTNTEITQDQDQDSLLVKRRNDNHSPGPVIRELVPSSHQRSELSNTILCIFSG